VPRPVLCAQGAPPVRVRRRLRCLRRLCLRLPGCRTLLRSSCSPHGRRAASVVDGGGCPWCLRWLSCLGSAPRVGTVAGRCPACGGGGVGGGRWLRRLLRGLGLRVQLRPQRRVGARRSRAPSRARTSSRAASRRHSRPRRCSSGHVSSGLSASRRSRRRASVAASSFVVRGGRPGGTRAATAKAMMRVVGSVGEAAAASIKRAAAR